MKSKPAHILDVAERLFGERGYGATATRSIAEESGVNIGMLSYYFGSKEGVFEAVVERRATELSEKLNQSINEDVPPYGLLRRYLDTAADFLAVRHPAFLALIARESTASQRTVLTEIIARHTEPHRRVLRQVLQAGEGGFFETDADRGYAVMVGVLASCSAWPSVVEEGGLGSVPEVVAILSRVFVAAAAPAMLPAAKPVPAPKLPPVQREEPTDSFGIGIFD